MTMTVLGLARAGAEAHLIVPNVSSGESAELMRTHFAEEMPNGFQIHRLPSERAAFGRAAIEFLSSSAKPQDIIITRSLSLLPSLLKLRDRLSLRCYFESHDCYFAPWQRDDASLWSKWKPMLRERWFLPKVDGLICLRESQARIYRQHLGDGFPIYVVPTGYLATTPVVRPLPEQPVMAYLGSLRFHKGLDNVARLAGAYPQAAMLVIGGKSEQEIAETRALFRARGCTDNRLKITGWIDKHRMAEELATAHWGLCPLHDTYFNRYLTSPVKIHDYFAVGLPVVTSDLPTLRELVTDGRDGLIVDWEQPESIARRLAAIDPATHSIMCSKAYERASKWTWTDRGRGLMRACAASPDTL